jgi:hypothetical protein
MKYIERSGQKPISHLGGLETEKLVERMRDGVPTEEEDLTEPPCSSEEEFGVEELPTTNTCREGGVCEESNSSRV